MVRWGAVLSLNKGYVSALLRHSPQNKSWHRRQWRFIVSLWGFPAGVSLVIQQHKPFCSMVTTEWHHYFHWCGFEHTHLFYKWGWHFLLLGFHKVIRFLPQDAVENKLDAKDWPHQSECPAAWNGSGAVRYSRFPPKISEKWWWAGYVEVAFVLRYGHSRMK